MGEETVETAEVASQIQPAALVMSRTKKARWIVLDPSCAECFILSKPFL
jgi:hypothetical protein